MDSIRQDLERLVADLRAHSDIDITIAEIGDAASEDDINEARELANGTLPTGVESFYRQVGCFKLEWTYTGPDLESRSNLTPSIKNVLAGFTPSGAVNIIPITEIFQGWEGSIWFPPVAGEESDPQDDEWRYEFRHVKPFDTYVPEACMAFLKQQDGKPSDKVAWHYCGEELYETRYTFEDYVRRLLVSRGFWYWPCTLCEEREGSFVVEALHFAMPLVFGNVDTELFKP